jgi:cytochrome bd ubiquinol oxidase subunit II
MTFDHALPVIFMGVMGLAMLAYVVLDGYDLGVGILLQLAGSDDDKDTMIASIGPFWDANETWLVLGVGILLTVFPLAHGIILGALYLPVAFMLIGLTLRGVSFDFRVKARAAHKSRWDFAFFAGSLIAALAQGYMLGVYILGLEMTFTTLAFGGLIALCLAAGYALMGASWLVMKTSGALQLRAVTWARYALWFSAFGVAAVSLVTPYASSRIFDKWFSLPYLFLLMPIPIATAVLFWVIERSLRRLPTRLAQGNEYGNWVPFASAVGIFSLAFYGLAYSLFPFLVADKITVWQGATSPEAMKVIFAGACVVLPAIIGYTIFSYRVFRGKATSLTYE